MLMHDEALSGIVIVVLKRRKGSCQDDEDKRVG